MAYVHMGGVVIFTVLLWPSASAFYADAGRLSLPFVISLRSSLLHQSLWLGVGQLFGEANSTLGLQELATLVGFAIASRKTRSFAEVAAAAPFGNC